MLCRERVYTYVYIIVSSGGGEIGTAAVRFYHMLSAASATGEYEKICQGKKPAARVFLHTCSALLHRLNHSLIFIMHSELYF